MTATIRNSADRIVFPAGMSARGTTLLERTRSALGVFVAMLWAVTGILVLPSGSSAAAAPLLDLSPVPLERPTASTNPSPVVDAAGTGFFIGDVAGETIEIDCRGCGSPESRAGLFRTDGAPGGTRLVKQLPAAIDPQSLRAVGDRLYFTLTSIESTVDTGGIWMSDGTEAGTVRAWPAPGVKGAPKLSVIAATPQRVLFFVFTGGIRGTGGVTTGRLQSLAPGSSEPTTLWSGSMAQSDVRKARSDARTTADGTVWTGLPSGSGGALTLWRTDGTPAGTKPAGIDGSRTAVATSGNTLWLAIRGRVVRSDGSPEGTQPAPAPYPDDAKTDTFSYTTTVAATIPGRVFWIDTDEQPTAPAHHVWSSDGTTLTRISAGIASASGEGPAQLVAAGGRALYVARDPGGVRQLWSSDGLSSPIQLTQTRGTSRDRITGLSSAGGLAYFAVGRTLMASDGTEGGTRVLHAGMSLFGEGRSAGFSSVAGRTVFAANDPLAGIEPWSTDGTADGTHLLADLQTQPASAYLGVGPGSEVGTLGGAALFYRYDVTTSLWRSDGRTTERLAYLPQGPNRPFVRSGPYFYLKLQSYVDGGVELWRTDGTAGGTIPLTGEGLDVIDDDVAPRAGGGVVFSGPGSAGGLRSRGLWTSDGTPGSTHGLMDLPIGRYARQSFDTDGRRYTAAGPLTYFALSATRGQWRLWRTDGTAAGTRALPGVRGPITSRAAVGRRLWFSAPDGARGTQVWSTDGSARGTRRETSVRGGFGKVTTIGTGPRGRVLVGAERSGRAALWTTSGAASGATRLTALPGEAEGLRPLGGRVAFVTRPGDQRRLWSTDGTVAGTRQLGPYAGLEPTAGFTFKGRWYYGTGIKKGELWRTDGTRQGTERLQLRLAGEPVTFGGALMRTGSGLLFAAYRKDGSAQLAAGVPK